MSNLRERSSCKLRDVELRSGDAPEGVEIARARRVDDGDGKGRRRSFTVPLALLALPFEIVPQWLLVEAGLRAAWRIRLRRPETRAVRRQYLVDEENSTVGRATELEFRVGDDDATLFSDAAAG